VTIVSSGEYRRKRTALNEFYRAEDEYRRSRYPQRNTYRRRIEYRRAAFPIETLSGEGGRVHPTARSIRQWLCAFDNKSPLETYVTEDSMFNFS